MGINGPISQLKNNPTEVFTPSKRMSARLDRVTPAVFPLAKRKRKNLHVQKTKDLRGERVEIFHSRRKLRPPACAFVEHLVGKTCQGRKGLSEKEPTKSRTGHTRSKKAQRSISIGNVVRGFGKNRPKKKKKQEIRGSHSIVLILKEIRSEIAGEKMAELEGGAL